MQQLLHEVARGSWRRFPDFSGVADAGAAHGKLCHTQPMATLTISLTDEMGSYVEERIASGRYGNASEYFRDLVRDDQDRQRESNLESLLLEGLGSGDAKPLGRADFDRARTFVRELAAKKQAKDK